MTISVWPKGGCTKRFWHRSRMNRAAADARRLVSLPVRYRDDSGLAASDIVSAMLACSPEALQLLDQPRDIFPVPDLFIEGQCPDILFENCN